MLSKLRQMRCCSSTPSTTSRPVVGKLIALGILAGVATGVFVALGGGGTIVSVALVDGQSGDILWYNIQGSGAAYDLRDPQSCAQLVQLLLKEFPGMQSPGRDRL